MDRSILNVHLLLHRYFSLVVVLGAVMIAGCDNNSRVETGNMAAVLHYAISGEPQTLDPHVASGSQEYLLISALLEGLVSMRAVDHEIIPAVATHWTFDEDGMGATFYLRKAARWSNGDPVVAQDFVFAWRRGLNPKMGNQVPEILFPLKNAERIYRAEISDFSLLGAVAIDDYTLRLELEYPMPPPLLLLNLAHTSAVPLHEKSIRRLDGADARYSGWAKPGNYVGNGPFQLEQWRMQRDVRLVPNRHYWDAEDVSLERIVFYPVDSMSTQEKLFRSGQVHVTAGIPSNKVPAYDTTTASPLVNQPISRTNYVAVNLKRPPLDDQRVRRALAMAIDREALIRPVFGNSATPLGHYLPRGVRGYRPPELEIRFDPERAKALMASAGYPDGAGFPEIELLVVGSHTGRSLATVLQQMWRDTLNIRVTVTSQEYQVYLNSLVKTEFDLAYASWNGGPVPSGFLDRWITGGMTNDSRFSHPEYDHLINERSRSTADITELMHIFRRAEEILLTELPMIPLLQAHATYLKQPSVGGMPPNTLNVINVKELSLLNLPAWQIP